VDIKILYICVRDSAVCDFFWKILEETVRECGLSEDKLIFLDVFENPEYVEKYRISALPAVIIRKNGEIEVLISPSKDALKKRLTS